MGRSAYLARTEGPPWRCARCDTRGVGRATDERVSDHSGDRQPERRSLEAEPGSIYPTLQQLEDEGLVRVEADGGRRAYTLTDEGRSYVNEHADEVSAPWQAMSDAGEDDAGLKPLIGQSAAAIWQIVATGTPEQQAKSRDALVEFRRKLYAILAEDDPAPDNES